jgi:hypothetical protein
MSTTYIPRFFRPLAYWILCCTALLVLGLCNVRAANDGIRDSRGTEFWLTFLPNYHNNPAQLRDSLYIFITAEEPAAGVIEYYNRGGQRFTRNFSIGRDEFFIFSLPYRDFELEGQTSPNVTNPVWDPQNETIAPQVFHITSSSDITVYGLNQAETTSDAFIALPADVLGQEYLIMSHNAIGTNSPGNYDTPSQFGIVATEDNTVVTITPSAPTSRNPTGAEQKVTLDRGDAYLVQTPRYAVTDLTGSSVTSDKPIAVFSGHQRTKIPDSFSSRDHLVEQLAPIPSWGGSAFITPYPLASGADPMRYDRYRVLAAFDNTEVYIDGVLTRTLKAREFFESDVTKAQWITATGPIMVAQFKKSSNESTGVDNSGDPFMIVNSPVEQYLKRYHCFNVKAWEGGRQDIYGPEQFLTVIVPTDSIGTVRLNGVPIPASRFKPLSITSYSYTDRLQVQTGINTVEANVGIGVYVFGYGLANSYGYIGGMKYDTIYTFDPPDIIPPLVLGTPVCDSLAGGIYDTLAFDKGIKVANLSDLQNITASIDPIVAPARSVLFRARLTDPYMDGSLMVNTRDSGDSHREQVITSPGFTVRARLANGSTELPSTEARIRIGQTTCATIEITNYGAYPQTINQTDFNLSLFAVSTALPMIIPPGQTRSIRLCFTSDGAGVFADTLRIGNGCQLRPITALSFTAVAPLSASTAVDCETLRGTFYDTSAVSLNITAVEALPDSSRNVDVVIDPFEAGADSIIFRATLRDPFQDGRGSIVARNNDGIQGWENFHIPGFTVHPNPGTFVPSALGDTVRIKKEWCFPLELVNYGQFEQHVSSITFLDTSSHFTLTPASVTIPPGGRVTVQVCFYTDKGGVFTDTLLIGDDCVKRTVANITVIALQDTTRPALAHDVDQCELTDRLTYTDDMKVDWGIESFTVLQQVNCVVTPNTSNLPMSLSFDVRTIDRRADAIYRIQVVDSAGNISDTSFIIQGFTLQFTQAAAYPFSSTVRTTLRCDSIALYNGSVLPFVIENADMLGNTRFSLPLSQFPIVIPAQDTGYVLVCFEPQQSKTDGDTLRLAKYCEEERIAVNGNKQDFIFDTDTKCNVGIRLTTETNPAAIFIDQNFPNPAADETTLRFGTTGGPVRITLYNTLGNPEVVLVDDTYKSGVYDVVVEITSLQSGLYFYELVSGGTRIVKPMSIVR